MTAGDWFWWWVRAFCDLNFLDFIFARGFHIIAMKPNNGKYLKIAHRGASDYAPENTLKAYELALQMGADMCGVDVHLTVDGHPVLIHDADISRTTNGRGKVGALTLEALRSF